MLREREIEREREKKIMEWNGVDWHGLAWRGVASH
jgi:hypothetical protein